MNAQLHDRADDFDTQAFDRSVRIIGRLHGPTPFAADNRDPSTYLWATCWPLEPLPEKPLSDAERRYEMALAYFRRNP